MMKNILITLGILALLFLGGFLTGRCTRSCPHPPAPQIDTVYVDTTKIDSPAPVEVVPDGYELVPIGTLDELAEYKGTCEELYDALAKKPTVVTIRDTTYIQVPMMDYTFTDDKTYKALVRGYNVTMLHHESYQTTRYITQYETVLPKWEITPVLSAFYSPIGIGATAGLKVDLRAKKWQIEPSAEYGFFFDGTKFVRGPMFGIRAGYTLFAK